MSHKYLSNVQESKTFLTSNEIQIKNIGELALVLKEHGNTIYTNHVNENTNDFANWVEHCIGDIELSNELRNSDNLDHTFEIIQNRILNIVSSTNLKAENMEKNNVKIPSNEKLAHMINGLPNSLKIDIQTNISTGQQNLIEPNIENNSLYTNIEFNTDDAGQVDFNIEEESTNITIQYTKINNEENNNNNNNNNNNIKNKTKEESILMNDCEFKDLLYQIEVEKKTVETILDNQFEKNPNLSDKLIKASGNVVSRIKRRIKSPFKF